MIFAALFVVAMSAGALAGTGNYPPDGSITTTETGGQITVTGDGCGPGTVTITFNGQVVGTTEAAADGSFSFTFPVPANTPPGSYEVNATGTDCSLTSVVEVAGAQAGLASTGSSSATIPTAAVAAGAVLLGTALVVMARRRPALRGRL